MPRKNPRTLKREERSAYLSLLWSTIADLHSQEEVENFFKDLLSETEAIMLSRRIAIAKRLLEGQGYDEIAEELKTGAGTIARVHRWLTSGFGGYETTLKRLEKARAQRRKKSKKLETEPYSFKWLKQRYPLHFALFNLLEEQKEE